MWPRGVSLRALFQPSAEPQYFGVGKIERDQVEDYARRKGLECRRMRALAGAGAELRSGGEGKGEGGLKAFRTTSLQRGRL